MPSIVNAQKVKMRLHETSKTCVHLWLLKLWQSLLSILPVVFDRIDSSTKSMYGFDSSSLGVPSVNRVGPAEDLKTKIGEFLRLEEKMGMTLSVSIVFDATTAPSNTNHNFSAATFERGFTSRDDGSSKLTTSQDIFLSFPSLYMRGNVHVASPRPSSIMRRNSARKGYGSSEFQREEHPKVQNSPSQRPELSSWPYTSWPSLVSLLNSRPRNSGLLGEEHSEWLQADSDTSFYDSMINNHMFFVVMIRSTDDRRRLSALIEQEVMEYVNEIVSCLTFTELFKREKVLEIRRQSGSTFAETGGKMLSRGHGDFVELLQSIKEELGLRSPRTRETHLMSGRIGRIGKSAGSHQSHHAFFLGGQLMNAI